MYTASQAAKVLGVSQDFLRMKLRAGEYADIGEALKPARGRSHWAYPCYPAKVAARAGVTVTHEGVTYFPDGHTEEAG